MGLRADGSICWRVRLASPRIVRDARAADRRIVVLSSSCHTAIGSVAGMTGPARGVIWLDCHADFNTPESTGSGLLDGMTLACLTGRCWRRMCSKVPGFEPVLDANTLLVGARDLNDGEATTAEALIEFLRRSWANCPVEVVAFTAYDPALDEGDAVGQAALEVATVIAE